MWPSLPCVPPRAIRCWAGCCGRLIATLPETPRMAMILRYQEDLDPTEIAETMGIPLGTVKSHIQRSLALLREKLERRGVGER